MKVGSSVCLLAVLGLAGGAGTAVAQTTAFSYQGRLADAGAPANGVYDLEFALYDAPAGGTLLGTVAKDDVAVAGGLFGVEQQQLARQQRDIEALKRAVR